MVVVIREGKLEAERQIDFEAVRALYSICLRATRDSWLPRIMAVNWSKREKERFVRVAYIRGNRFLERLSSAFPDKNARVCVFV